MDGEERRSRLRTFLLGLLVGASAVLAALRRQPEAGPRGAAAGLAAFEGAPCYREAAERDDGRVNRS
ncbi:MAG TPA: hypothetical protein VFA44_09725 [Gaiellaceae bacterium]|nr:hypothetical protein [Gaiellaceae bacterium]